jgi:hypothetical protein
LVGVRRADDGGGRRVPDRSFRREETRFEGTRSTCPPARERCVRAALAGDTSSTSITVKFQRDAEPCSDN